MSRTSTKKRSSANLVKVLKIESVQNEDVYNMEVIGTHNFSVNGGLIVHNCMDDIRYFVNTILRKKIGKKESQLILGVAK
nr:MAG TPA: Hint (Hedgehog/Intein) domain C-terminal region [Caudoviricetes sp.]